MAGESARHPGRRLASLFIDEAFLTGLAYQEFAGTMGETEWMACFALPPGSAPVFGSLPAFEDDEVSVRGCNARSLSLAPRTCRM